MQFGTFNYVLAFTAIFAGIAKLGLDGIVVRELLNNPKNFEIFLGTAFWLKMIGALLVLLLMALILFFTSQSVKINLFVFIVSIGLFFQAFEVIEFYFQSEMLAKNIYISKVIQLGISTIIKIYLIISNAKLVYFILLMTIDALILAIVYTFSYKLKKKTLFYKYFNITIARKLIKDSWPLILSSFVVMIYMRIDQIMIKEMLGEYQVGIYSAAVRLSEAFYFIPMIITTSIFPAIIKAKSENENLYKKRFQRFYFFMIWLAIFISISMTFLSHWLVVFFFGQSYHSASGILVINIWSSIFVFIGVVSDKWHLVENLQKYILINTTVGALLNILLNLVLIKKFGAIGAAYSTLISYAVAAFFMNFIWRASRNNFYIICKSFISYGKIN
jgi:O-antigen/teichoic acid export membrane protein